MQDGQVVHDGLGFRLENVRFWGFSRAQAQIMVVRTCGTPVFS